MYVRSPGGILVGRTANVPGGFYQDEAPEELGTTLLLPPWFEDQRDAIVARLEPITVPQENRLEAATKPKIPLSRTRAAFDKDSRPRSFACGSAKTRQRGVSA